MKFSYNLIHIVLSNINDYNLNNIKSNNTSFLQKLISIRTKRQNHYPYSHFIEIDKDKYKITDLTELENGNMATSYTDGYIKVYSWKSPFILINNFRAHHGKITSLCTFNETLISNDEYGVLKFWKEENNHFNCIKQLNTNSGLNTQILCTSVGDIVKVSNEFGFSPPTYISKLLANNDYREQEELIVDNVFNKIHLLDNGNLCVTFRNGVGIYEINFHINEIAFIHSYFSDVFGIIPKNYIYECEYENGFVLPYYNDFFEKTRKDSLLLAPKIIIRLKDGRYIIQLNDFRIVIFNKELKPIKYLGKAKHITKLIKLKNERIAFGTATNIYILK
jgi:hypothetical protein